MVNIAGIMKTSLLIAFVLGGIVFDKVRNFTDPRPRCTEEELQRREEVRMRVAQHAQEIRESVDAIHGEGFFDNLLSGKISLEECKFKGEPLGDEEQVKCELSLSAE